MTLRQPLSGKRHATIVSAHAPSMTNRDEVKDVLWWSGFCDFCSTPERQTRPPPGLQFQSGHKPPNMGRRNRNWRSREVQQQSHPLLSKCAGLTNTVVCLPTRRKTSWMYPHSKHWHLVDCHSAKKRQTRCQSDKHYVWYRLVDMSQACFQQTQPAHSACTTTTRQESAKEIGCLQAETKQQEASIRQWYLQLLRCTGTQFRRCRWELDSLQRHRSLFSNGFPRTSISQTPGLVCYEWQRNPGTPWRETPKNTAYLSDTSSVSNKITYSNIWKTVQTRLRDMQDSWLSKQANEIQFYADRKDMKKCLMHLRQYMVPRAQKPPHFLVQMELVFSLTRKLTWKDVLDILMVYLIGHRLSVMKLSTEYHRWNVIRCLMSS